MLDRELAAGERDTTGQCGRVPLAQFSEEAVAE